MPGIRKKLVAFCRRVLFEENGYTAEDMPFFGTLFDTDGDFTKYHFMKRTSSKLPQYWGYKELLGALWVRNSGLCEETELVECNCKETSHKDMLYGKGRCAAELAWMLQVAFQLSGITVPTPTKYHRFSLDWAVPLFEQIPEFEDWLKQHK